MSYVAQTSVFAGSAAATAEIAKRRKYDFLLDTFYFVPVAVETSGVLARRASASLKQSVRG